VDPFEMTPSNGIEIWSGGGKFGSGAAAFPRESDRRQGL
jgi:hypothetical protein